MARAQVEKSNKIRIGVVATDETARQVLELAKPGLQAILEGSFPDYAWTIERIDAGEPPRKAEIAWFELARDEQIRRDLDFTFAATSTDLPSGLARPTVSLAARSLSAAIVPVDHVGSPQEEGQVDEPAARFHNLFLHLLGLLLGLDEKRDPSDLMAIAILDQVPVTPLSFSESDIRDARLRLSGVTKRAAGVKLLPEMSKGLAYLKVMFTHPLLIIRRALACKPWRLVTKLHKLVFPAIVAVPLALISQEVWDIGVNMNGYRLAGIAVAVVFFVTVFIIVKQKLLERMPREGPSDQVALFNLSTMLAILLSVTIVLGVIFAATLVITAGLFPRKIVIAWLHARTLTAGDYLRVSLLIGVLSSIIGWLGAGFTESDEFRLMLYTGTRTR